MGASGHKRCWRCSRQLKPGETLRKMMGQLYCPKCIKEMESGNGTRRLSW